MHCARIARQFTLLVILSTVLTPTEAKPGDSIIAILEVGRTLEGEFAYVAAESVYASIAESVESADSGSQRQLIETYIRLAAVRIRLCHFDEAQEAYERALLTATTRLGPENVTVAAILNGLGRIEHFRGNYGKSERLFRRSLRMAEIAGGKKHIVVAEALRGLADVYRAGRRFNEGEEYALRALRILKDNPAATAEDLALCHVSLGFNMRGRGAYNSAGQNYLSAQAIAGQAYGEVHPVRAFIYNHQALLHNNLYETDKAMLNANRALDIAEKCLGTDHIESGMAHYNLARAYTISNEPEQAMTHYLPALTILQSRLGDAHPIVAEVKGFQSFGYRFMNRFDEAMDVARDVTVERLKSYSCNSAQLDDRSSAISSSNIYYAFSGYPAYYFDAPRATEEQSRTLAQLAISTKGIVNDDIYIRRRLMAETSDPKARTMLETLGRIRAQLSAFQLMEPERLFPGTDPEIDSLKEEERIILSSLAEAGFLTSRSAVAPLVNIDSICGSIPDGACLVEYYGYLYVPPTTVYQEDTRCAAVVLDRNGIRGHVNIPGKQNTLMAIVDSLTVLLHRRATAAQWDAGDRAAYDSLQQLLYSYLWAPVEPLIEDARFIILAVDYGVTKISFSCLQQRDGSYLGEHLAFQYVYSGRELLRYPALPTSGLGLFAVYDPDYDASPIKRLSSIEGDPEWRSGAQDEVYVVRNVRPMCEKLDSLDLPRLSNTRAEIRRAVASWQESSPEPVEEFDGARACEETIKHRAGGHRFVHIATHGYYVERNCRAESPIWSYFTQEPMLYSGLLLSGANLGGRGADEVGAEDGILTAHEVSSIDLHGTQVVILSACETGLGEASTSQGTFGISRAFQMAGARQVVSALWPVSDAASIEVMEQIYSSPDKTIAEALQEFAIEKIKADRAAGRVPDPFYWAPYVSYGDWRAR